MLFRIFFQDDRDDDDDVDDNQIPLMVDDEQNAMALMQNVQRTISESASIEVRERIKELCAVLFLICITILLTITILYFRTDRFVIHNYDNCNKYCECYKMGPEDSYVCLDNLCSSDE
jgi:hypothetical protein